MQWQNILAGVLQIAIPLGYWYLESTGIIPAGTTANIFGTLLTAAAGAHSAVTTQVVAPATVSRS